MIVKQQIERLITQELEKRGLFLIDIEISQNDEIVVTIDSYEDVKIDDCVELSRIINSFIDAQQEDYSLTVTSAGLDQPLKTEEQYKKYLDKEISVLFTTGKKLTACLKEYNNEGVLLSYFEKIQEEGKKRKVLTEIKTFMKFNDIRYIKPFIKIR